MMTAPIELTTPLEQSILHVGCGGNVLPEWLKGKEIRLDISPEFSPDIVANMLDLGDIGEFDAVYCSHSLEHLAISDVEKALKEFKRVLKVGGCAFIFVPDLEGILPTQEVLFVSEGGPITGLDLIYGYSKYTEKDTYMRHLSGFTRDTLDNQIDKAGFSKSLVQRMPCYNLMGVGVK